MKINELMLGDWLIYKGETICKVVGLDARRKELSIFSYNNLGHPIFSSGIPIEEFEPIPLTVEILDKNGLFDSDEVNYDNPYDGDFLPRYFMNDGEFYGGVEIVKENNKIYASINCAEYFIMELRYVHELQHLLCLNGINKEIII